MNIAILLKQGNYQFITNLNYLKKISAYEFLSPGFLIQSSVHFLTTIIHCNQLLSSIFFLAPVIIINHLAWYLLLLAFWSLPDMILFVLVIYHFVSP